MLLHQVRALARWRPVHVTFDDAYGSAGTVFPALRDLGVTLQIFVCAGYAREGDPLTIPELAGDDPAELATMTWDELREHGDDGIGIGSHSVSHPHLPALGEDELRRELRDSKAAIEDALFRPCPDFAYPYGEYDRRVREATRAAGYERAYALRGSRRDPLALPRLDLYRRHTIPRTLLRAVTSRA